MSVKDKYEESAKSKINFSECMRSHGYAVNGESVKEAGKHRGNTVTEWHVFPGDVEALPRLSDSIGDILGLL